MKDYFVYLLIVADLILRYYHLLYMDEPPETEWFVWNTTQTVRMLLMPLALLFKINSLTWEQTWITRIYLGWLSLDFLQQLNDNNYGEQWWELLTFIIISTAIYVYGRKNKLV